MRKRITSLLLTLVMLLSLVPAMGVTASAADDTYGYGNIKNWDWFKSYLESPTSRDLTLENDIDYTTGYDDGAILIKKSQKLDLNGHKIRIDASKRAEFYNLITIRSGEFTLYDSKGGGAIEVEFARDSKGHCIIMISPDSAGAPAKFTMNGGTLTRLNPIDSNVYGNNGCISDNYFVPFEGGERPQITINGGTINCPYSWDRSNASMRQVEYMPTALLLRYSNLTVKGGTFNGIVWTDKLSWKEGDAEPRVLLNGGEFNFPFAVTSLLENKTQMVIDGARFNDGLYVTESIKESNYKGNEPAMLIKSGVFDASGQYLKLDIYGVTRERGYDLRVKQQVIERVMKFFPNSAIKVNGKIYTSENIGSRVIFDDSPYGGSFYLNLNLKGPIEVIPNAWGMKSVTLDGDPIDYFKDWKGTVERMDNSTAHTLKFEWYPLASELVNAGYTYRTTCEHYISGSTAVQQTDTIAADKTSHTITIPAGADPKVYSYDLQLNLDKNGSSVGIIGNQHIVKLVVSEAADTFISTVSFNVDKADVGEPGELSFEAKDKNGNTVAIHPNVTWEHDNIQEGINHVSFTIPAPDGYTFSGENGKVTTLKFGGVDVIGYVDGDGALNYSFPLDVVHRHKADHVSYNAKYHWEACSCGQKIMNTSEQHTMSDWVAGDTLPSGGVVYNRSCISGCGYTETTIDYKNVKHVTSLVLNMENYPMDGMRPHNFVHQEGDETVADTEIPGQSFYKLTHRDSTIKYPSFSIATGNEKVKLSATNPEAYDDPAENPDFAKWTTKDGTLWLRPDTEYSDYEKEFKTGAKYKAHLTLDAKNGYAFYEDFKTNQDNFKLYTDMEGITIEQYGVRRWYYFSNKPSYDDANVPEGWGWYTQAPADNSAGASRVQIVFMITARNEGDLNITLPELKAGDDLKEKWAVFEGTPNFDFVKDCYRSETMAWRSGPSCVIHNNTVTGESVTAQAGQTYRLEIPAVNENVLAHITIKNPTAATKIVEMPSGAITVTYTLPAAADDKIVNGAAVSITPPASGATPNTTAAVTGTAHCTASTVTWTPDEAAFGEKAYTATVTLTAETDYTFANDAVFTINGHKVTPEAGSTTTSVTLSYAFPALAGPHTHTYGSWIFATPDTHIRYCTTNDGSYEEAPHSITSWTDKGDGKTHTGTCTDCGYEKTENHSWEVDHEVPPTVTAEGTRYYKCSACAADKTESIPKLIEYSVTVKDDGNGTASASPAKAVAGTEITLSAKAKSGYHFKEWKVVTGSVIITDNKFTMPDEAVEIKAIFEKNTSTGGSTGGGGGGVTTYAITVKDSKNGDVIASHKSAAKGTTVILTVDPDKGYVLDTLTVLDGNNKDLKLTEKNGKYTFTMPASKVTVAATFKASAPTGKNPFIDVPAGSYYEDAVVWAVEKGITSGTSAVTFDPNGICTRAQAVTFLWRAAGSPAPKSMNSFADVPADAYYAKAVAWAVENGITSGTGGGKFSPDATCTRAQIVTFLYRAAGSPAVSGGSVFSDVKAGAYYADAVTWAASKGITGGIGNGLFGSDNNCTRAQVVTFLYRYVE